MGDRVEAHVFDKPEKTCPEYWIKVRLDEEFLRAFWGRETQPSLEDLARHVESCVQDWLEGKMNERRNVGQRNAERDFLTRNISPTEFFD